ncbi:hypothetical protein My1_023 [Pectobacterium phage My1]|uniref:Uncharacterized protein n=1 Tax=Pectobacterium phage My1 TaxID=1204539 RepID=J9QNU6_9CAUD|nr:hypothetical protein My1_023 [Pectobacterium phage My1]AFQ22182.1 hypothetical protein My1_023 [Pectobacterium phage My1]
MGNRFSIIKAAQEKREREKDPKRFYMADTEERLSKKDSIAIVKEILDLPYKVSDMSFRQKQLADLVLARSCTDPDTGTHVGYTNETAAYPRVLRMTNNTFFGFLNCERNGEVPEAALLKSIVIWEDEPLDVHEVSTGNLVSKDPYREATFSYLKGVQYYRSPRTCKGRPARTYSQRGIGATDKFLSFEPEFHPQRNLNPETLGIKELIQQGEVHLDFEVDVGFLIETVSKYSELTEEQKYVAQLVCEPVTVHKKGNGSLSLSGDNPVGWVLHPKAKRIEALGKLVRNQLVNKARVEVDCPINWYPQSPNPKKGEIFPVIPRTDTPYSSKPVDKNEMFALACFELLQMYQRIRQGKPLQEYQEAIRYVASYRDEDLAKIAQDYVFDGIDLFDTIYRDNLPRVSGTISPTRVTKNFLIEYICAARIGVFLNVANLDI